MYWLVLDVIKNTYNQNGKKFIQAGTRRLSTFLGKWFVKTELEGVGVWLSAFKVLKDLQPGLVVKGLLSTFVICNWCQVPISRCQMSDE